MGKTLDELNARLDEIKADITLVRLAIELGPRAGAVLDWVSDTHEARLAKRFVGADFSGEERLYAGILLRIMAAFERYVRQTVEAAVDRIVANGRANLPETLIRRNMVLTGSVLSHFDTPSDHLAYDYSELIQNLASVEAGVEEFRLNPTVFSAIVTSGKPSIVEKALNYVEKKEKRWQDICRFPKLQAFLGTKRLTDTETEAQSRLTQLCKLRNQISHGGDQETSVGHTEIVQSLAFIELLSEAIETEMS